MISAPHTGRHGFSGRQGIFADVQWGCGISKNSCVKPKRNLKGRTHMVINELRTYTTMPSASYMTARLAQDGTIDKEHMRMVQELMQQAIRFCEFTVREDRESREIFIGASLNVLAPNIPINIIKQQLAIMEEARDNYRLRNSPSYRF
jgi:hypothetical protein